MTHEKHYYEKVNCNPVNNHDFTKEEKIFSLLADCGVINFFGNKTKNTNIFKE